MSSLDREAAEICRELLRQGQGELATWLSRWYRYIPPDGLDALKGVIDGWKKVD